MFKRKFYICALLALYLFSTGCVPLIVGAAAGGTGYAWYKGELEETLPVSVSRMHQAAKAGLKDLEITVLQDHSDKLRSEIKAVMADGTKVSVEGESMGNSTTKLSIRVGYIGDKNLSLRIRDAIKKHL